MATTEMTLNEIREKGYSALLRELGPVGYVRFLQQFSVGDGDFTAERRTLVDSVTTERVRAMLDKSRNSPFGSTPARSDDENL